MPIGVTSGLKIVRDLAEGAGLIKTKQTSVLWVLVAFPVVAWGGFAVAASYAVPTDILMPIAWAAISVTGICLAVCLWMLLLRSPLASTAEVQFVHAVASHFLGDSDKDIRWTPLESGSSPKSVGSKPSDPAMETTLDVDLHKAHRIEGPRPPKETS